MAPTHEGVCLILTKVLEISYEEWTSVMNYPYAGLDFILSEDGQLYFIEANAVAGGIGVITTVYNRLRKYIPMKLYPYNDHLSMLVRLFAEASIIHHIFRTNTIPKKGIVTVPIARKGLLNLERRMIARELANYGVETYLVVSDKIRVKNNLITAEIGNKEIIPDIVIRRTLNFPKKIAQTVINPSEVGKITGNKWRTYKVVVEAIKNNEILRSTIRIPITFYAKNLAEIENRSRELLEMGKSVIIKPVKGQGGKGVLVIGGERELESKLSLLNKKTKYLVQEKIESLKIIENNKPYAFDIRVYTYLGKLVGIQFRRAPHPITPKNSQLEFQTVCNISAGGAFGLILMDNRFNGLVRYYGIPKNYIPFGDKLIETSQNVLIFGKKLMWRLNRASSELTKVFSLVAQGS